MILAGMLLLGITAQKPEHIHLLPHVSKLIPPIYPLLAKAAHDSRTIVVESRENGTKVVILKMATNNKYFEKSIKDAISEWTVSKLNPGSGATFDLTFEFRMTDEVGKDGLCEIYMNEDRIVVWGLARYTDTETLPMSTTPSGASR